MTKHLFGGGAWRRACVRGRYFIAVEEISEVLGSEAYQAVHGKSTSNCMTFVTSDLLNEKRQTHKGL